MQVSQDNRNVYNIYQEMLRN